MMLLLVVIIIFGVLGHLVYAQFTSGGLPYKRARFARSISQKQAESSNDSSDDNTE